MDISSVAENSPQFRCGRQSRFYFNYELNSTIQVLHYQSSTFISKFVKHVIHKQFSDYDVESQYLLPCMQSGCCRHHSTETAVIKVYNDIIMFLESGFSTALLLLDFAAFNCVNHTILLKLLQVHFGVTASALQWISSFLLTSMSQFTIKTARTKPRRSKPCKTQKTVPI